ncbi:SAVMC3_10250 family protein [Nocardia sp. 004]|uniref:SAVMC3_10250 family protein n=1 Tax=Nocardia sp. 004 TaxID=3385978 RepID=UPI0039A089EE
MEDELIYFSQTKAQGLLASNGHLTRGLKFDKGTLEGSLGVVKASASIQSREYALQVNASVVKRLELELFRNGDVFDMDGDMADGLQRGAWFRFSRPMAFGEAFRDAGLPDREPEALYFVDMPDEPPQCRLLMFGSLHHRISSVPVENGNRTGSGTDKIWRWWEEHSAGNGEVNPLTFRQDYGGFHPVYEAAYDLLMMGGESGCGMMTGLARVLDLPYHDPEHAPERELRLVVASPLFVRYTAPQPRSDTTTAQKFRRLSTWKRLRLAIRPHRIYEL